MTAYISNNSTPVADYAFASGVYANTPIASLTGSLGWLGGQVGHFFDDLSNFWNGYGDQRWMTSAPGDPLTIYTDPVIITLDPGGHFVTGLTLPDQLDLINPNDHFDLQSLPDFSGISLPDLPNYQIDTSMNDASMWSGLYGDFV